MTIWKSLLLAGTMLATCSSAWAGQAPGALSAPDVPISHHDRVYAAEQFSNTLSVTDPVDNKLLGVIKLGDAQPANFSPLYKGQVLVHGLGYSPDHKTLAVVSIGSNSVTFIDTATNAVKHTTYVGRSPHEAFFTPDGKEVWVTIRGENYVSVIDATRGGIVSRRSSGRRKTGRGFCRAVRAVARRVCVDRRRTIPRRVEPVAHHLEPEAASFAGVVGDRGAIAPEHRRPRRMDYAQPAARWFAWPVCLGAGGRLLLRSLCTGPHAAGRDTRVRKCRAHAMDIQPAEAAGQGARSLRFWLSSDGRAPGC